MGASSMPRMSRTAAPKQKTRPPQSQPFDPNELTRKLYAVLAEQKAYAEKKRRYKAKAEADRQATQQRSIVDTKPGPADRAASSHTADESASSKSSGSVPKSGDLRGSSRSQRQTHSNKPQQTEPTSSAAAEGGSGGYRHVPQVAALQFARTTKSEDPVDRHLVHRLSRPAMKFHLDGPNASREMADIGPESSPCESAKALRRAQSMRERLYERNQFQHATSLQAPLESDEGAINAPQARSFDAQARPRWVDGSDEKASRRISTGTILGWDFSQRFSGAFDGASLSEKPELENHYELAAHSHPDEHRVDWTQSDETVPRQVAALAPRKQESRWTLKGRIVKLNRHGKEEKPMPAVAENSALDDLPKWPKSGFFARFKR